MRAVVQRVSNSSVAVNGEIIGSIGKGVLVLLGVTHGDSDADIRYLADKITTLRIFDDSDGRINLSLADVGGAVLIVSQFTLYADTRRGRRPSFLDAANGAEARELYDLFVQYTSSVCGNVQQGVFGAMMEVSLTNDGPFTILFDSKVR